VHRERVLLTHTFVEGQIVAGRYRVVRFLARGGMGEVYEAFDAELHDAVALKTIRAEIADEASLERFKREIHIARRIAHPNVCRVFDLGRHDGGDGQHVFFLTMELLRGETLAARIARGRLTPPAMLPILDQLARGLEAAHAMGVIHRDLKPSNVVLTVDARSGLRVVVTDFGLAHAIGPDGAALAADDVDLIGTAPYMSPEQLSGSAPLTPATDVYSLGVVLYEALTQQRPFASPALLPRPRPAPLRRRSTPEISAACEQVVLRCLETDPVARFDTIAAAAAAFRQSVAGKRFSMVRTVSVLLMLLDGVLLLWAVKNGWYFFVAWPTYMASAGWPMMLLPLLLLHPAIRTAIRGLGALALGVLVAALLAVALTIVRPTIEVDHVGGDIDADDGRSLDDLNAPSVRADTLCRASQDRAASSRRCDLAWPESGYLRIRTRLGFNRLRAHRLTIRTEPADVMAFARVRADPRLRLSADTGHLVLSGSTIVATDTGSAPLGGSFELRILTRQLAGVLAEPPTLRLSLVSQAETQDEIPVLAACVSLVDGRARRDCDSSATRAR
jgi:tRNA A-37 threonylcarbamoyl transferase component Bud32